MKIFIPFCFIAINYSISAQNFLINFTNDLKVSVIDTSNNNKVIISPALHQLWVAEPNSFHPVVNAPLIDTVKYDNGFDVIFNFQNNTGVTSSPGWIYLDGIRFDSIVYTMFSNYNKISGDLDTLNNHNTYYFGGGAPYPGWKYSPVEIIANQEYTIAISLQYPVLDYKHSIFMRTETSNNVGGFHWGEILSLNDDQAGFRPEYHTAEGDLQPGETRTYTLSVRLMRNDNDTCKSWLNLIDPYKKYFRNQFGNVKYKRDNRPVSGISTFQDNFLSPNNRYGWVTSVVRGYLNPVTDGFQSFSNYIRDTLFTYQGFERTMMYAPSGLSYSNNLNFPFKFTSHWLEGDTNLFPSSYGHMMGDAFQYLPAAISGDNKLGLWWGHCVDGMTDWDSNIWFPLDIHDSLNTSVFFNEIDLAVLAGASEIGLDYFVFDSVPFWELFQWLNMLRIKYPALNFIQEQGSSDFMHTLYPFYYYSNRLPTHHFLADYLLPGHETWAQINNDYDPTGTYWHTEFSRLSNQGYIPLDINSHLLDSAYLAIESWYKYNPQPDLGADLILDAGDTLLLNAAYHNNSVFLWNTGATTASVQITEPGIYTVTSTNTSGCVFSDTVTVTAAITTSEITKHSDTEIFEHITVFPNPGNNETNIRFYSHSVGNIRYHITDLIGNTIYKSENMTLKKGNNSYPFDLKSWNRGMYIIRIVVNDYYIINKPLLKY
jgi:hypothetical protein